jgi:hypothetical protein
MSKDDDLGGDEEVQRQLARAALASRLSPAALQVQERDDGALGRTPVRDEDTPAKNLARQSGRCAVEAEDERSC